MGYEAGDIQFTDDALGVGRALRIIFDDGSAPVDETDVDNPDIKVVRLSRAGDGSMQTRYDFSNVFLLMGG